MTKSYSLYVTLSFQLPQLLRKYSSNLYDRTRRSYESISSVIDRIEIRGNEKIEREKKKTSKFVVVHGPFVKCSRETGRARTAAEEETTAPEDEGGQADWNCEQYTDQYSYEDHRVFFRSCVIQIQAT